MEGKFPSKILVFVTTITHNCDSFFYWSQIFHILPSICEGFILPSQIRFFERAFWVHQKFLVANRHFFCSEKKIWGGFNLAILIVKKFIVIEWKFTIDFLPKSKATSCRSYSHDHAELWIYGLFYLNLLHTNTHVYDFEIPLKILNYQLCMIL